MTANGTKDGCRYGSGNKRRQKAAKRAPGSVGIIIPAEYDPRNCDCDDYCDRCRPEACGMERRRIDHE